MQPFTIVPKLKQHGGTTVTTLGCPYSRKHMRPRDRPSGERERPEPELARDHARQEGLRREHSRARVGPDYSVGVDAKPPANNHPVWGMRLARVVRALAEPNRTKGVVSDESQRIAKG